MSVLSLLLCVATLALWGRSYRRADSWYFDNARDTQSVTSVRGQIELMQSPPNKSFPERLNGHGPYWHESVSSTSFMSVAEFNHYSGDPRHRLRGLLGFGYMFPKLSGYTGFWFPHWSLALLSAMLPALRLRAAVRSRCLHRTGHCPRCGYDLRATPARCPECGTERESATDGAPIRTDV